MGIDVHMYVCMYVCMYVRISVNCVGQRVRVYEGERVSTWLGGLSVYTTNIHIICPALVRFPFLFSLTTLSFILVARLLLLHSSTRCWPLGML